MTDMPTIMILDDQLLVAFQAARLLEKNGFQILGPFGDIDAALAGLEATPPRAAVLDINLGNGMTSEALADALVERNLPFVFYTGYGSANTLPERFSHVAVLSKPVRPEELISAVNAMTATSE
ncbi:MAG: response regulator [Pseudomonadota bacterium]